MLHSLHVFHIYSVYTSFSQDQTNNKMYKEQMRLMRRHQSLEEHKKQEAVRLDRERGLHEGLRQEEELDRKRYLRQAKEELKEKQMENDLFKAGYRHLAYSLPSCHFDLVCLIEHILTASRSYNHLCPRPWTSLSWLRAKQWHVRPVSKYVRMNSEQAKIAIHSIFQPYTAPLVLTWFTWTHMLIIITFNLQAEEDRQNCEKQLEEVERKAKEMARTNIERRRDEQMRQYIKENRYVNLLHYLVWWYVQGQYKKARLFAFMLFFQALNSSLPMLIFKNCEYFTV